jgi:cystathionine gamma-lyase
VIHVGGEPDKETGAIMPPIFQTSTYVQKSPGKHSGYEYTRSHNPTRTRLEENLASLEDCKIRSGTASGLSMMTLIMHSFPKGNKDSLWG